MLDENTKETKDSTKTRPSQLNDTAKNMNAFSDKSNQNENDPTLGVGDEFDIIAEESES